MSEDDVARTTTDPTEASGPKQSWNTDPLFDSQGGPDNAADGVMAAANGVVALWRKVRGWFGRD